MASGSDAKLFQGISATTGQFTLFGGVYGVSVTATWNNGTVALNMLGPDGLTWITALTAFSANGYGAISLPPGQYQFAIASATNCYIAISRVNN